MHWPQWATAQNKSVDDDVVIDGRAGGEHGGGKDAAGTAASPYSPPDS